jgi:hypothetical protein
MIRYTDPLNCGIAIQALYLIAYYYEFGALSMLSNVELPYFLFRTVNFRL